MGEIHKEAYSAGFEMVLRNFLFIGTKILLRDKFADKVKYNLYPLHPVRWIDQGHRR